MAKKATPRRSFSDEFKQDAVNRVLKGEKLSCSCEGTRGQPKQSLSLEKQFCGSGSSEPELALEKPFSAAP